MTTAAGIDVGAKTTKVLILRDGQTLARAMVLTGFDEREAVAQALEAALDKAGLRRDQLERTAATGVGAKSAGANETITDVRAAAVGATHLVPSVHTVIDVGAEDGRAIQCAESKVLDFAVNEKCAAGAGAFTESMARALDIPVEQMGPLSLKSTQAVPMNAQCAVFAESEVVSLIHQRTGAPDIARAVHDAIASRISSMVRRVGSQPDVVLIGGVARNVGFIGSLERALDVSLIVPEQPEYVAALGAALVASNPS